LLNARTLSKRGFEATCFNWRFLLFLGEFCCIGALKISKLIHSANWFVYDVIDIQRKATRLRVAFRKISPQWTIFATFS
jgi:hypothetical protein